MSEQEGSRPLSRRFILAAILTALVITAGAIAISTGGADAFGNSQLDDGRQYESEAELSVDEAIEIAEGEADGRIDDVELDRNGDRLVYEIEVGETDVYIDAMDGTVLYVEHDDDDDGWDDDDWYESDSDDVVIDSTSVQLSPAEAIEIAKGEADGAVDDVELERFGDLIVYEIEVGEMTVHVDAMDGTVHSVGWDD